MFDVGLLDRWDQRNQVEAERELREGPRSWPQWRHPDWRLFAIWTALLIAWAASRQMWLLAPLAVVFVVTGAETWIRYHRR